MNGKKTDIDSILKKLKDRSDEGLARLVYTGRALSKSDSHLHLCVSSGVVLIPISEIESINHVSKQIDEDLIHVTVKNADRVRHALRREQLKDSGTPVPAGDSYPYIEEHFHAEEHGTVTGGEAHGGVDACDATDVYIPPAFFESR